MFYRVSVKEVHNQYVWVEADNIACAIRKVEDGKGDNLESPAEYEYTLESDEWGVEEETTQNIIDAYKHSQR